MEPTERMRALLRYANSAKVARGLTAAGYPVSGPTVSRWAKGSNVTALAVRLVEDLLDMAKEPAPFDWDRLMRQVDAIAKAVGVSVEDAADRSVRAVLGHETPPQPDGDGAPSDPKRPAQAHE